MYVAARAEGRDTLSKAAMASTQEDSHISLRVGTATPQRLRQPWPDFHSYSKDVHIPQANRKPGPPHGGADNHTLPDTATATCSIGRGADMRHGRPPQSSKRLTRPRSEITCTGGMRTVGGALEIAAQSSSSPRLRRRVAAAAADTGPDRSHVTNGQLVIRWSRQSIPYPLPCMYEHERGCRAVPPPIRGPPCTAACDPSTHRSAS